MNMIRITWCWVLVRDYLVLVRDYLVLVRDYLVLVRDYLVWFRVGSLERGQGSLAGVACCSPTGLPGLFP